MFIPVAVLTVGAAAYAIYEINYDHKRKELRSDMYRHLNCANIAKGRIIKFYGGINPMRYRRKDDCDDFYTFGNIELRVDAENKKLAVCQYIPRKDLFEVIDFDEIIDYRIVETSPGSPKTGKTKSSSARSSATDSKDGAVNRLEMQIITSNILRPIVSIKVIDREVRAGSYRYKNAMKFVDEAYATVLSIMEANRRAGK